MAMSAEWTKPSQSRTRSGSCEDHDVEFYTSEESLTGSVARYTAEGLSGGETVVLIAGPEHVEAVLDRLASMYLDIDRARGSGRLVVLDAQETLSDFLVGDLPDADLFRARMRSVLERASSAAQGNGVRAYGEMVDILWREGRHDSAIRLERLWNELAAIYSFRLLCAYGLDAFRSRGLDIHVRRVYSEHSHVSHLLPTDSHFRLLVDSVKDYAIFMLDRDGRVASWNRGAERLKGYRPDEILGEHFSCFYPRQDIDGGKCELELKIAARDGRFEDEGWRLRKDGTPFWANVVITALHDEEGRHIGFAKVTRDLTERKRAAEELLREEVARSRAEAAREKAEQTLRFSEMVAGMLGHDLRNPLAAIKVGAEVVLRSAGDEKIRTCASHIVSSSNRMARMIDQLLDFTRIRLGGGFDLSRRVVDLSELSAQIARETEAAHRCSIKVEHEGDALGVWDGDRLAQVLSNLLANAAQHGVASSPIALTIDGRGPHAVRLRVQNEGEISSELLPQVFDPFRRRRGGPKTGGLGLGLYIAHEVVRAHDGSMEVTSSGGGTTFVIELPRQPRATTLDSTTTSGSGAGNRTPI
jgi:PAS domain S-box-containing protein